MKVQVEVNAAEGRELLTGLVAVNLHQLRQHLDRNGTYPSLLEAIGQGLVRYDRKDPNEDWKSYDRLMADGVGDCEDLACGVAAEFIMEGIPAWADVYLSDPIRRIHHVIVLGAFGKYDPSKAAGMGRA